MKTGKSPVPGNRPAMAIIGDKPNRRSCAECNHCHGTGREMHCRRYPPVVFFNPVTGVPEVKYPGVLANWFCGEQKYEGE